jgi:hypothetical protein
MRECGKKLQADMGMGMGKGKVKGESSTEALSIKLMGPYGHEMTCCCR